MKNFFINLKDTIEEWWWNYKGYVRCLNELRSTDLHEGKFLSIGAFCKRRLGHKGYHSTGNKRVKWKD